MSKNNEIQRKSDHKIAFPTKDENALTTLWHSADDYGDHELNFKATLLM